jgi:hypothetical protein
VDRWSIFGKEEGFLVLVLVFVAKGVLCGWQFWLLEREEEEEEEGGGAVLKARRTQLLLLHTREENRADMHDGFRNRFLDITSLDIRLILQYMILANTEITHCFLTNLLQKRLL